VTESPRIFSRRKFLAAVGLAGVGVAASTRFLEPRWLAVGKADIKLPGAGLAQPVRILHLSDLHASPVVPLKFIAQSVALGLAQKPDLIFLTGDFITAKFAGFTEYAAVLRPLADAAPCFATLGNHDGGSWAAPRGGYEDTEPVRELLAQSRVRLLHNQVAEVAVGKVTLRLVGLGDWWAGDFAPGTAFASVPPNRPLPTLVLSHNPDTKDLLADHTWDALFCGHTHGGQLALPLIGTPFAPVRDQRFVRGLHAWQGRWIYITKGVGNLHGVRFNCRPEVSLIMLT
jgi:predicted MPP superfamily phosphohydrolase